MKKLCLRERNKTDIIYLERQIHVEFSPFVSRTEDSRAFNH